MIIHSLSDLGFYNSNIMMLQVRQSEFYLSSLRAGITHAGTLLPEGMIYPVRKIGVDYLHSASPDYKVSF